METIKMKLKKYKPLLEKYFKKVYEYRDRNVFDIEHSISRFNERFPSLSIKDYEKALQEGIDIILDIFKDSTKRYMVISKSKQFAIQIDWRKDIKSTSKLNHGFSATTLDYETQKQMIKGDTKLFVESFKKNNIKKWFGEKKEIDIISEVGYYALKLEECKGYEVYIKEGKIYKNFTVIEVS
jgi:hypothetical protein